MIVWLEDRRETVSLPIAQMKRNRLSYTMLPAPQSFLAYIQENCSTAGGTCGHAFIIDIMLHGFNDLKGLGVGNAPTHAGNNTGFVLVERLLRAKKSEWQGVPVFFLTERHLDKGLMDDIARLQARGQGPLEIGHKYSQADCERLVSRLQQWGASA